MGQYLNLPKGASPETQQKKTTIYDKNVQSQMPFSVPYYE